MAGYAAVISLKQTIEHLLESSRISLIPPSAEKIRLAHTELEAFQKLLRRLDDCSPCKSRKKVNALDGRMKEAVWGFEDLLESHLVDQIILQTADHLLSVSIDLQGLQRDVDSFVEALKDTQKEYIYELENMPLVEEDEYGSSRIDSGEIKSEMVGLSHEFEEIRNLLTGETPRPCVSLIGMAGIGKTTLAKKLLEDVVISTCFEHRVWVTVGRRSQFYEIARGILAQVDPNMNQIPQGDEEIGENLKTLLEGKRCLIVLDDVWDSHLLDSLVSYLPRENNGETRILLTTRLRFMATLFSPRPYIAEKWMRRLYLDESKDLLRQKVFGKEEFPPQLEKAAEKIAMNCGGLPLMVYTVAHHLSKAKNNDPNYWNEVANEQSSAFMDAYNETSKVLFPTYDFLPQNVKMLCLYVGGFPPDHEIHVSKLTNLWSAEGLITPRQNLKGLYEGGTAIKFGNANRILRYNLSSWNSTTHIKTFRVYSWWWHMFNREASREKFVGVLCGGVDGLEEGLKHQRRLCLHGNFLFSLQNMYDSVKCDCASTVRSLLCFGPLHTYPMPLDVGFKLLRVLDALRVRFYNFPVEVMELVLLQYLALTYNGALPCSISKLLNLQFLIIHPHTSIRSRGAPSYVPVQIWDMQELKHIEILGSNLPNPNCGATLLKLSTLLGVSPSRCTRDVLKKLPNIRKLGIRVELTPYDDDDHSNVLSCFEHVSELKSLEKLKFCIVNPEAPVPLVAFPSGLRKLVLSGLGYPWEHMNAIGSLPNLEALKLQCHAFRGPKWETGKLSFERLQHLAIEDTDLVQWKSEFGSFSRLVTLRLKNCYKLQELNWVSDSIYSRIELVDCNPLAVSCAQQLQRILKNIVCVDVYASFDGEELMDGF